MNQKKLKVAMLEDDSDDRYLTNDVVAGLPLDLQIDFYANSNALFTGLQHNRPHLVLVDFNAAPENGLQVLKHLKSTGGLQSLPVVILSDSDLPKYREACYAAGASAYVVKPSSLAETKEKIATFFTYWTQVAAY